MNTPKVSIVMATYNTPKEYLKKSVKSILNQKYTNFEFIIVCDGCKKDVEFLSEFEDKRIRLIIHKDNKGLPKSLNEAIEVSTGKYIARMDSDDIALKSRIAYQVKYMEKHSEIMISGMEAKFFGKIDKVKNNFYKKPKEIEVQLLFNNCLIHPTIMVRSEFLINNKIRYNEKFVYSQDYELWSRIVTSNNTRIIPKIGIFYRVHDNQISTNKKHIQINLKNQIIKNNSTKIKAKDEINVYDLLLFLAGNTNVDKDKCEEAIKTIKTIFNENKQFDVNVLKRVFLNRVFQIQVTNRKTVGLKSIFRGMLNLDNFAYLVHVILNAIKSKINLYKRGI